MSPTRPGQLPRPTAERWTDPEAGERYATHRFSSSRKEQRDPHHLGRLLDRWLGDDEDVLVLDVPAGTGRLRSMVEARGHRWLGCDVSASMLGASRESGARELVRGDATRLPLRDRSVGAIVSCRFLHHLGDEESFRRAVGELVRVSDRLVVATFWNEATLAERWPRGRARVRGRHARSEAFVRDAFARADAEVLEFRHSFRFVSRQSYVAARRSDS